MMHEEILPLPPQSACIIKTKRQEVRQDNQRVIHLYIFGGEGGGGQLVSYTCINWALNPGPHSPSHHYRMRKCYLSQSSLARIFINYNNKFSKRSIQAGKLELLSLFQIIYCGILLIFLNKLFHFFAVGFHSIINTL